MTLRDLIKYVTLENLSWGLAGGTLAWGLVKMMQGSGPRGSFTGEAEGYAPLEDEKGCSPAPKPGVVAFKNFVLANFKGSDLGITRECIEGAISGHQLGRAWDWGVAGGAQTGAFFQWLFANGDEMLRRAGITYLIFERRIWNTRAKAWQNYTGSNPHTDHVHISFGTPGANGQTSFFRGNIA